jgi:hypothetical protein
MSREYIRVAKSRAAGRKVLGFGRSEHTVVTVNKFPLPKVGVREHYVISSNLVEFELPKDSWRASTLEGIEKRLRKGGGAKGRVLYAVAEDWKNAKECCAVVCYHFEKAGTIVLSRVDTPIELPAIQRSNLVTGMLTCSQQVARHLSADRKKSVLLWPLTSSEAISDAIDRHQFTRHANEAGVTILRRVRFYD